MSETTKQGINWQAVSVIVAAVSLTVTSIMGCWQESTHLSESNEELRRQQRPVLAFEHMSHLIPIAPSDIPAVRFQLPRDNKTVLPEVRASIPAIKNFGSGPAFHITVSYENEAPKHWHAATAPMHCRPGETVQFFGLPSTINSPDKQVDFIDEGRVRIACEDISGTRHFTEQRYIASVDEEAGHVFINIGEITEMKCESEGSVRFNSALKGFEEDRQP